MRRGQRQSAASALVSIVTTAILAIVLIQLMPAILASVGKVTTTPEPSGVSWTPADAEACLSTATDLQAWPNYKGGLVSKVGLGISQDVKAARPLAADAARAFSIEASSARAPGAEAQLAAMVTEFNRAAGLFDAPMTVTEFRAEYRAIGKASFALLQQCHAVGRWVQDHSKQ